MSEVAPGCKLRVLLAQALFADPDILLLDEPTNNLDINTIRWLEDVINARSSTMVIISHDRHFLNSVCTHMADLDYGTIRVYPGNYDDYMIASTQARERLLSANAKTKDRSPSCRISCAASRPTSPRRGRRPPARGRSRRSRIEDVKPSSRQNPYIRFEIDAEAEAASQGGRDARRRQGLAGAAAPAVRQPAARRSRPGQRLAIIGPNGAGKTTLLHTLVGEIAPGRGTRANGRRRPRSATSRRTRPPSSSTT